MKTKSQVVSKRLEIIGLFSLAKEHYLYLRDIEEKLMSITGEGDQYGQCGDIVWSEIDKLSPENAYKVLMDRLAFAPEEVK